MKPPLLADPIAVVEAGYALEGSNAEWIHRVGTMVFPAIDDGLGMLAYYYQIAEGGRIALRDVVRLGGTAEVLETGSRVAAMMPPRYVRELFAGPNPFASMREVLGEAKLDVEAEAFFRVMKADLGAEDAVALRVVEPGGRGIIFTAARKQRRVVPAADRRLWSRVAAHLSAANRLRCALASLGAPLAAQAPVEAVLEPNGKVAHAEGEARSRSARAALHQAVRNAERARGRLRRSQPAQAVEAWAALVCGRWSLVDRFERDGRRYLVARRNELQLRDPRGLTSRQRAVVQLAALGYSNKLIGYALGLTASTVATHAGVAMRKLAVGSRAELVRLFAAMPLCAETAQVG